MTRQEIINQIITVAKMEVEKHDCSFSQSGLAELRTFVTNGVNENMSLSDCNSPERIALAKNHIREISVELCHIERLRNKHLIDGKTIIDSKFHFCPRYPFCK